MKFNSNKFRKTIVFIHGFRKDTNSWNYNSKNKAILIQLEDEDYKLSVSEVSEKIYSFLKDFIDTKMILVTHSNGSFYKLKLVETYPDIFRKLFLIKTPEYLKYLQSKNPVERSKVENFEDLPTGENILSKVIIRIHFNYTEDNISLIPYYNKLTNKNMKSRFILHYDIGHMIHWKIPDVIIASIREL
jgi:pimeloyl-ACP methyl ester carboxylesterase